jgi:fused signal recognition particle receptor
VALAIHRKLGLPIRYVGVGEGTDDLLPFDPDAFVEGLLG